MKLRYKYNFSLTLSLGVLLTVASCKEFVEVATPTNLVATEDAFLNDATAQSSVLGLYANNNLLATSGSLENSFLSWVTGLGGASADDIYYSNGTYLDDFKNNTVLPTSNYINNPWNFAYAEIFAVNSAIEGLNASTGVSAAVKQQLLGEAHFIRAFTYFYITSIWGDVPLVTSTNTAVNTKLPRNAQSEVYALIISDLKQAQNSLGDAYPSTLRARVNKSAAAAMLARIYLYQKDYVNAEIQSSAVIAKSDYKLETLDNTFINTSNEVIWQRFTFNGYNIFGNQFIPSGNIPNYVLYPSLAASFETGDMRFTKWLRPAVIGNTTYYYPYKYKVRITTGSNEYNVLLRLSEQYLIRAEARANQGKVTGTASAAADLNVLRSRAGLGNTAAATQSTMLLAIESERAHEFFAEMGHRWFDLNRTGRADAVLGALKPTWKSTSALFPIPNAQIQYNANLTQNPGY
jgi:hypothetical protein